MAKLRTDRVPTSFGEHVWKTEKDVVEVSDQEALELLAIPDAGFEEVIGGHHAKTQVTEPDPDTAPPARKK